MRIVLDACVLYPTVMREILLKTAQTGLFVPLWSERILSEWHHAATGTEEEAHHAIGVEIALLKATWLDALILDTYSTDNHENPTFWLPDPADIHVLETALTGQADAIMTLNIKDFPTRILSKHRLLRFMPDDFLTEFAQEKPDTLRQIIDSVHATVEHHSGQTQDKHRLLKRACLPKLGKLLYGSFRGVGI